MHSIAIPPSPRRLLLCVPAAALLLCGCQPTIDDDDETPTPTGRVTVVGGGVYDSIQDAIDAAPEGATIEVSAGDYDEDLDIGKSLYINGVGFDEVRVTGGGTGTVVEIDLVDGLVQLTGMSFIPDDGVVETIRGFRITESSNVLLHEVLISFLDSDGGSCTRGLAGIEISQSTLILSDSEIYCVGFEGEAGGTGILAQTDSALTVADSFVQVLGSFGIHAIDSSLQVADTEITSVNRPASAGDNESDGSGIYVEQSSTEVVLDGVTLENGAFVAAWVEAPYLTVSNSSFATFPYGIYHPGDSASAAARQLTLSGSTFTDLYQEAVLAVSATQMSACTVKAETLTPDIAGNMPVGGARIIAPLGSVSVTGSIFEGLGVRGLGVYGNADGNVASAVVADNSVSNIVAGRGIDVAAVDAASITGNIVAGIDHAYDAEFPGSISSGFGIDCFDVGDCELADNEVSAAEFGNFVFVDSGFRSTNDVSLDARGRGFHVQTSQGTIGDVAIQGSQGYGVVVVDSSVLGTGGEISGGLRGIPIEQMDGVDDPPEEELFYYVGGYGIWVLSQGAPTFMSWSGATIQDNVAGAVQSQLAQIELVGNSLINNGFQDESGNWPDAAIYVYQGDELSVSGPLFEDNLIVGNESSWATFFYEVPGLEFRGNTVCGASVAGMYVYGGGGASIEDNFVGTGAEPVPEACAALTWSYGIYLAGSTDADGSTVVSGNTIAPPSMIYGISLSATGDFEMAGNLIQGGTSAGIYASASAPIELLLDDDFDGYSESNGDCDDTNPAIVGIYGTETLGDGLDNDCDGVVDDGLDTADDDGDGASPADGDCDDGDPNVGPAAEEVFGNGRDDDCDGWADWDGELPQATLQLAGNELSGGGSGLRLDGVAAVFADGESGEPGNVISGSSGAGISLSTWEYAGTPGELRGSVSLGASTLIENAGSHCVEILDAGSHVDLGSSTLSGCQGSGVSMAAGGSIAGGDGLGGGPQIVSPSQHGIVASAGTLALSGGSIDGAGLDGIHLSGTVEASVSGVSISNSAAYGLSCDGGDALEETPSSVSLDVCAATVSNNASGDWNQFNGCETETVCTAL
jgi:hypothetical protein